MSVGYNFRQYLLAIPQVIEDAEKAYFGVLRVDHMSHSFVKRDETCRRTLLMHDTVDTDITADLEKELVPDIRLD